MNADLSILPAPARPLRLAVVGSRSLDGNPDALRVIRDVLDAHGPLQVDVIV